MESFIRGEINLRHSSNPFSRTGHHRQRCRSLETLCFVRAVTASIPRLKGWLSRCHWRWCNKLRNPATCRVNSDGKMEKIWLCCGEGKVAREFKIRRESAGHRWRLSICLIVVRPLSPAFAVAGYPCKLQPVERSDEERSQYHPVIIRFFQ